MAKNKLPNFFHKAPRYNHIVAIIGLASAFIITFSVSPLIVIHMTAYNGLPVKLMAFVVFPICSIIWLQRMRVQIRQKGWKAYFFPEPIEK
jgi:phosphatidylserine synthase